MTNYVKPQNLIQRITAFICGLICALLGLILLTFVYFLLFIKTELFSEDKTLAVFLLVIMPLFSFFFLYIAWRCIFNRRGKNGALIPNPILYLGSVLFCTISKLPFSDSDYYSGILFLAIGAMCISFALIRRINASRKIKMEKREPEEAQSELS